MPDRISRMLDSMITAVDEGFSYDGIVSIPETGLEDIGYRTGLPGLLDDGVDGLQTAKRSISRTTSRVFNKLNPRSPRRNASQVEDEKDPQQFDTYTPEKLPRKRTVYGEAGQGLQQPHLDVEKSSRKTATHDEGKKDPQPPHTDAQRFSEEATSGVDDAQGVQPPHPSVEVLQREGTVQGGDDQDPPHVGRSPRKRFD